MSVKSSTQKSERSRLIESLKSIVIPEIENIGFTKYKLPKIIGGCTGKSRHNPLGLFKRAGKNGTDLLTFRFDKHGRPYFSIDFGTAPQGPLKSSHGPDIPHDEIWVNWLPRHYGLYRSKLFLKPFKAVKPFWRTDANQTDFDNLAKSILPLIPQIEDALENGKAGRNTYFVWWSPSDSETL